MSQDEGGEERIRVHSVETFMRVEQMRTLGQVRAQVWHVLPWARGFEEERYQALLKVERKFPHPMVATEAEMNVMATNPRLACNEIIEHPTAGLEHRLFLGRN